MVAGQAGLGKTSFLATLFEDHLQPPLEANSDRPSQFHVYAPTDFIKTYAFEMEGDDGDRLFIEAIDTAGFSDDIDPSVRLGEIQSHLERAFDEVFEEEQRVHRNPKFEEHRVHALLYFIEPTGLGLKSFDAEFMRRLAERVNVIPVIAKADGLTSSEKGAFKKRILDDIRSAGIKTFDFDSTSDALSPDMRIPSDALPFCVIGTVSPRSKDAKRGRPYPWGVVEVDNSGHSDFSLLKRTLLSLYRDELKEATEDGLYEKYRTEKLISNKKAGLEAARAEKFDLQAQ